MSEPYLEPSQAGKPIVMDDAQSLAVLRAAIDKDFTGVIETDKDYWRTVFYFRAIGLKNDLEAEKEAHPEYAKYALHFSSKKSIDRLFECVWIDSAKHEELLEMDEKYDALYAALLIGRNDCLYEKYRDDTCNNNYKVQFLAKIEILKPYLNSDVFKQTFFEVTKQELQEKKASVNKSENVATPTQKLSPLRQAFHNISEAFDKSDSKSW